MLTKTILSRASLFTSSWRMSNVLDLQVQVGEAHGAPKVDGLPLLKLSLTLSGGQSATYQMPTGYPQPLVYTFPVMALPLTSSTYFIYRIQLSIVSHEIVTQLY